MLELTTSKMRGEAVEAIKRIYDYDQEKGESLAIALKNDETGEYISGISEIKADVKYLEREGYLRQPIKICNAYILALTEKGEDFIDNNCTKPVQPLSTFNFSGATINNSVIAYEAVGNTINGGSEEALAELHTLIGQKPMDEQVLLNELLEELRVMQRSQKPIEKGKLSRFYEVMKKSTDLFLPLAKFFVEVLF